MKIDLQEIYQVARLARLKITEEEAERLMAQLNRILTYMDKLNELDTTGIEPMAHALPLTNAFRVDEVKPSLPPEEALANAPQGRDEFFTVPKVL